MHKKTALQVILLFTGIILFIAGCVGEESSGETPAQNTQSKITGKEDTSYLLDKTELFGKTILGLYKSSDNQSEDENLIFYHLSLPLKEMGFTVKYHDIDESIPTKTDLEGVRAVISWYTGASMEDPESYLDFVNSVIDSGRKFIVFDNFGTWQYRLEPDKYISADRVNYTLSRLGIRYKAGWTADAANVVKIEYIDSEIAEAGGSQILTDKSQYYTFKKVDRNAKVYLSLKRTDEDLGSSSVVLTNKNGGFAFTSYIYKIKDGNVVMLIDLKKFLENALFPEPSKYKIILLADTENELTNRILLFTNEILIEAGLDVEYLPATEFDKLTHLDLRPYTSAALIVTTDSGIQKDVIEDYLNNGGSIVSLYTAFYSNLAPLLGSVYNKDLIKAQTGYKISQNLVMANNYALESEEMKWQAGPLAPESSSKILGTDYSTNTPLIWYSEINGGKAFIWNWNGFSTYQLAGLILETFLYVHPVGAANTFGFAHMFVDDWPCPMYDIVKEPYDYTDTYYYTQIWWPDIKNLFAKYNIPYSTYSVFNYNVIVEPPFTGEEFYVSKTNAPIQIIDQLKELEAEIGLHGYNHASLTIRETDVNLATWPSRENIVSGLTEARRLITDLIGEQYMPFSYVAPNNILDQTAISAIHEVFPSVKIIAALRWGIEEEFYSPFIPHPEFNDVYFFPRITYGYKNKQALINNLVSGVIGPGVISHFIHPDDVYDPYRSENKNWDKLREEFDSILAFVKMNYPWIEWVGIRDAYYRMQKQQNAQFNFKWEDNTLYVSAQPGVLFRIRQNDKQLLSVEGANIIYSYSTMPSIILKATGKNVVLRFN